DVADDLPPIGIARHEQRAHRVFAGLRQAEAQPLRLLGEELVWDLHQDAGAVAGARIGADRAAMLEIAQDGERILDQLVRLAAVDIGDESDPAGILLERGIVHALRSLKVVCASVWRAHARPRVSRRRQRPRSHPSRAVAAPARRSGVAGIQGTPAHWQPSRYRLSAQRVAARVRRPGDAMALAYQPSDVGRMTDLPTPAAANWDSNTVLFTLSNSTHENKRPPIRKMQSLRAKFPQPVPKITSRAIAGEPRVPEACSGMTPHSLGAEETE